MTLPTEEDLEVLALRHFYRRRPAAGSGRSLADPAPTKNTYNRTSN